MSYPDLTVYDQMLAAKSTGAATAANLAATAAQWVGYVACGAVQVRRIMFAVTTTVTAGLVAPVVQVQRRPTIGSATNAVSIVTMTIPTTTAAGKVVYKDVPYLATGIVNAGEELSLNVSTQATDSGTAAGAGYIRIQYDCPVDQAPNQTNMVVGT